MILDQFFDIEESLSNRIDNFKKKICPYCNQPTTIDSSQLKWTCSSCKSDFYVWYGNKIRKKYIFTDNEYKQIDKENKLNNVKESIIIYLNQSGLSINEYEVMYNEINKTKTILSFMDILWKLFNKYLVVYINNKQYGLYRNIKYVQSQILFRGKKYQQSLESLFEVSYYDLNGYSNGIPSFDPKNGSIYNPLVEEIKQTYKDGKIKKEELVKIFINTTQNIHLPISANDAWLILSKKLRISA